MTSLLLRSLVALLLLTAAVVVDSVVGLFEDEVGKADWHRSLVGVPFEALLVRSSSAVARRPLLMTASTASGGTLASLNVKDGSIIWRQALNGLQLIRYDDINDAVLSVSTDPASNATLVQSWNPHTGGFLNWAHHQSPSSSSTTARSSYTNLCTLPSTGSSALLSDNRVILLRSDGVVEWRWRLEEDDKNDIASSTSTSTTTTATTFRLLSCTSDSVYVTGVTSDGQVMAVSISLTTGKSVAKRFGTDRLVNDKENNRNSDDDLFVLDAVDAIVWNAENGRLCSMDLSLLEKMDDYVPSSTCSHAGLIEGEFIRAAPLRMDGSSTSASVFFIHSSHGRYPATLQKQQLQPIISEDLGDQTDAVWPTYFATKGSLGGFTSVQTFIKSQSPIYAHVFTNGKFSAADRIGTISYSRYEHGGIKKFFLLPSSSGSTNDKFRLLLLSDKGALMMYRSDGMVWSRDEYLTEVQESVFVELPEANMFSEDHDELDEPVQSTEALTVWQRFVKRCHTQFSHLQNYALNLASRSSTTSTSNSSLSSSKATTAGATTQFRDKFGKRKLIVFASKSGMIHAMDTLSGETVWKRTFVPYSYKDYSPNLVIRRLILSRSTMLKYPAALTVVFGSEEETVLRILNAYSGRDIDFHHIDGSPSFSPNIATTKRYPFAAKKIISFPYYESEERLGLIGLVDQDFNVHVFPDTGIAKSALEFEIEKPGSVLQFYHTDGIGGTFIHGYSILPLKNTVFPTIQVWEFQTPVDYNIIAMSDLVDTGNVASIGRVLGDRSVMYKYLNPNMLSFITYKTAMDKSTLKIYLLDTVTGNILYSTAVLGVGPISPNDPYHPRSSVNIIQVENWVVATYYNHGIDHVPVIPVFHMSPGDRSDEKGRRTKKKVEINNAVGLDSKGVEVLVLEIFETSTPNARGTEDGDMFSSFTATRPYVVGQSFVFQEPINAIGVTSTGQGITTKELLFALESNQIFGISKRVLDPRRPLGAPSAEDREEGLIPYKVSAEYNPKDVASYFLQISGIQKIVSSSSHLESTSLVCAYGQDIFFTQRTPSKAFDVLSEDFSRGGLVATIVGLVIGIIVSRSMVARKKIKDSWR